MSVGALAIAGSAPNVLYVGVGGPPGSGVFKTTNGGQSWVSAKTGLPNGIAYYLAVDPNDPNTAY